MPEQTAEASRALADELRNVVSQAEELLQAIAGDSDEALNALRDRVYGSIDAARARLEDIEEQASQATQRASIATEAYLRDNPWMAVAVGASLGLIIGALLGSRRSRSA